VTPWDEGEAINVDCARDQRVTVREWIITPLEMALARNPAEKISNSIQVFPSFSRFRLYRQIEQHAISLSFIRSMLVER
jgi:hypothetical protein